ncbi:MAG: tail fiber domain-containing protein [Prolixibacteraceae bacterium]
MGTSNKQFSAIYSSAIFGNGTYLGSDERIKENFKGIDQALFKVLQMKGQKYDFISESSDSIGDPKENEKKVKMEKDRLGFIAQDMLSVLPEAVYYDEDADQYYIEYTAIIPVIVEAIKEQQVTIDDLTARIEKLEGNSAKEKSSTIGEDTSPATLNQNIPNPFSANTTINMYLPNTVTKAVLYIYTMQGEQIQKLTINERGNTAANIESHSLKAGMYLYTLIADGKEVDTKKMILTK